MVWGKLFGSLFGFLLGARFGLISSLIGALLGSFIGDFFDRGLRSVGRMGTQLFALGYGVRETFFATTFSIMGFLAKSDGRVSEDEIKTAEMVMVRLGLNAELKKKAIARFTEGKQTGFDWRKQIKALHNACNLYEDVIQLFIEIQIELAYADGVPSLSKKKLLIEMAEQLGFSQRQFIHLDTMFQARQRFQRGRGSHYRQHSRQQNNQQQTTSSSKLYLQDAYTVLGLEPNATDAEVKRAYRKLMSQHHPDKLMAQGVPEEMIKLATEKTQQVKSAYEQVLKSRGT